MVLHSQNSGKYFTKKWNDERTKCMLDSSGYTAAEKAYYEVDGSSWMEGSYQQMEDTLSNLETTPIDPLTTPKKYDQRDKPEVGW